MQRRARRGRLRLQQAELADRLAGLADGVERAFWLFDTDEMYENAGAIASRFA